ncbi:penicillin-binding protein 2 [Desulfosalsimonas propionicica]|uniref:Penicillin-binding protein 2 n=1 Tax=Desulfosalsimonas propionicica TaxID=332175 RepID=A0A7W0CB18_9BACT|nr:penicillin-binding protein 2 [Desulfosalsimonas propionicica]MBA2882369.1 penicillin-binding protein 2 [Desulfosalsimonas propionicica]
MSIPFLPKIDNEWFKGRILLVMLFVLTVFALLAVRLFYLQILKGEHYRALSANNTLRQQRIEPLRGSIYDRNGHLLVDNRPSFELRIIPNDAKPLEQTANRLSQLIDMTAEEIKATVRENQGAYGYASVLLKGDISRQLMAVLLSRSYELPGITIATSARRNYIYDPAAAHLIGYLGEVSRDELRNGLYPYKRGGDMVGRAGVEKTFEDQLSGIPGRKIVQVNAVGQVVRVLGKEPAEAGHNLYLTIDFALQQKAEALLEGKSGSIVAVDPRTGEVLAMASRPVFQQEDFVRGMNKKQWRALVNDPKRPLHNKAIQAEYPPASTYKIITAMAALEEGVMDEQTTVYCPGGLRFGNRTYRCWKRQGHGSMDINEAIAQSCDVFFYQAGKQLGVDRIAEYAKASGLGQKTGIPLAHEAEGLVPTSEWKQRKIGIPWQAGENLSIAIGQGYNLATPLQMAMLTAAVANGGKLYKPRIMRRVESVQGRIEEKIQTGKPDPLPASQETLEIIRKGLYDVVQHRRGTAYWYVRSKEVAISGKTGTAQVISRKAGQEEADQGDQYLPHAWFVGYAPSDRPEIAVCVFIEHGEHGSSGAGPLAKEMVLSYLTSQDDPEAEGSASNPDPE